MTAQRIRVAANVALVCLLLVGLWEGYRVVALALDNTWPGTQADLPIQVKGSGNAQQMPHIWTIFAAFFEPYRSGGETLGSYLLVSIGLTARAAGVGLLLGSALGIVLAMLFQRSRLAERAFMPYVVASQTVPFIAFAPILVVAMNNIDGAPTWAAVALLSMYLAFFPMTINTLRGLRAAGGSAEELMRSYAVGWWAVLWKLRFPTALPYLFIGLKIAAPAAVVGAIVGEISSPGAEGLGAAIFGFGRISNNAVQLFASTAAGAALGIASYLLVVAAEKITLQFVYGGHRA